MRVAGAPKRMRRGRSEHGSSGEGKNGRSDGFLYAGGWRFRHMSASSSWSQPWRSDKKSAIFGFRRLVILFFVCLVHLLKRITASPSRWRLSCHLRVLCRVLCHSACASTWPNLVMCFIPLAPRQVSQSFLCLCLWYLSLSGEVLVQVSVFQPKINREAGEEYSKTIDAALCSPERRS